jgi:hypothetical protein
MHLSNKIPGFPDKMPDEWITEKIPFVCLLLFEIYKPVFKI